MIERPHRSLGKRLLERASDWLSSLRARAMSNPDLDREEARAFKQPRNPLSEPQLQMGISIEVINWEGFTTEQWLQVVKGWNPLMRAIIGATISLPEEIRDEKVRQIAASLSSQTNKKEDKAFFQIVSDFSSLSQNSVDRLQAAIRKVEEGEVIK